MMLSQRLKEVPYWGFWLLLAYMPFHIFLSQYLSTITGGLEAWKIAKDIVTALLALFTICLVWRSGRGSRLFWWFCVLAAVYLAIHGAVWLAHTDIYQRSAILGVIYNNRLIEFAILGWGAAILTPAKFAFSSFMKGVIGISSVVAILGIAQYFLPSDLLTHFGYSLERGARPAFLIDDRAGFVRIMSTLREPNALGAYLLVPLALIMYKLTETYRMRQRSVLGCLLAVHLVALVLTQSRSAWLAFAVTAGLLLFWRYQRLIWHIARRFWYIWSALVVGIAVGAWAIRDTTFFHQYIVHSNPDETVQDLDSNDLHIQLAKEGLQGAVAEPIGHGPGTAGLVSIQNPDGGQLTENYYIQLAYEIGWLGLACFVAVNVYVYRLLWRRQDGWGYVLCATFWGYVLTNMLLHTWSNEAVALQWWLLAGLALGLPVLATTQTPPQRS
jgi:hypothetical protein